MTPRYFSCRLTKGGPIVAVKMLFAGPIVEGEEQDRSPRWQVLVDTEETARAVHEITDSGIPVEVDGRILRSIQPIDEPEYRYLTARGAWAQEHSPYHPSAAPQEAIDLRAMKSLF